MGLLMRFGSWPTKSFELLCLNVDGLIAIVAKRVDDNGLKLVNLNKEAHKEDPFILAS